MTQYAADTTVSSERSRQEIEKTLQRYGARQFMYGFDEDRALVMFVLSDRQVRFVVPMPNRDERQFKWTNHVPPRRRTMKQEADAYEQATRQRWRALNLVIKAKLEAVESGIVSFEAEFMAHIVLPGGRTVADHVVPRIAEAYATNEVPALLADYGRGIGEPGAIGEGAP